MRSVRTRTVLFHWQSHSLSASVDISCCFSPAASDAYTHALHAPELAGVWQVLLFSFTIFLFSSEWLSLLESSESSVTVDLHFNFCSQLEASCYFGLIYCCFDSFFLNGRSFPALASLMAIWFSFGHSNICPRDLENELPLQPKNNLSVTKAWKGNGHTPVL